MRKKFTHQSHFENKKWISAMKLALLTIHRRSAWAQFYENVAYGTKPFKGGRRQKERDSVEVIVPHSNSHLGSTLFHLRQPLLTLKKYAGNTKEAAEMTNGRNGN